MAAFFLSMARNLYAARDACSPREPSPDCREGRAAHFTTTVELDTYLTVARRGKVVRFFDAGFRPPRRGALPEESGLDWGARRQNTHATAWAFLERVTRIRVSREWFEGAHPAFVFRGKGP